MKNILTKFSFVIVIVLALSSCRTVNYQTRASLTPGSFLLKRSDYKITKDASAEITVETMFWGLIKHGIDNNNIKYSNIENVWLGSFDEKMAVYELLEKNPNWDYVTNVRFVKSYEETLFSKTYKTKVIAKGIIIKTDN